MAMSDDDRGDPQPTRMIYDMRRYVQQIRNRFWEEGVDGQFSPRTKRDLAAAAIQYWDMLYEFRGEHVLEEGDFPDISPVRSRIGETTEVLSQSKRRGGGVGVERAPAVSELDDWYLLELTEDLDDLAKRLGFAANAREATPHDDIDHSDLAALLEARGQDEALDKVPGGG
jgi:hypothetical protein